MKIISLISIAVLLAVFATGYRFPLKSSTVRAVGDLEVDWGVPEGNPIFVVNNLAPGQTEVRNVIVTNNASTLRPVGVRGIKTSETGPLSTVLDFTISEGGTDLYGGTLEQFFTESSGINGLPLFNLNPGATKTINFKVVFDESAGNAFQAVNVIFDLKIGIAIAVPEECAGIKFNGDPIFGTSGRDVINGTNGNDLIFAFEGNDVVNSSNGDDCVVGGPGNDIINNSNGHDILFGNEGNDRLNGSNGNDLIMGGPGNDVIKGSNGNDRIEGGEGNDEVDGGNGNDTIWGGAGDDQLAGGNGSDNLQGEEGNDALRGGNGNDTLLGGAGTDSARGDLGTDTCEAETKTSCEL